MLRTFLDRTARTPVRAKESGVLYASRRAAARALGVTESEVVECLLNPSLTCGGVHLCYEFGRKTGACRGDSLCWDCKNAYGGCSWTRMTAGEVLYEPVEGWDAFCEYYPEGDEPHLSYQVYACPEFIPDRKERK